MIVKIQMYEKLRKLSFLFIVTGVQHQSLLLHSILEKIIIFRARRPSSIFNEAQCDKIIRSLSFPNRQIICWSTLLRCLFLRLSGVNLHAAFRISHMRSDTRDISVNMYVMLAYNISKKHVLMHCINRLSLCMYLTSTLPIH